MKIAYNSAYVQTETKFHLCPASRIAYLYFVPTADVLNVGVIDVMTTQHYNLASRNSLLLRRSQNIGNGVTFLQITRKTQRRP